LRQGKSLDELCNYAKQSPFPDAQKECKRFIEKGL
jgi:hypothetical protein